jgi:carboxypeptidase C (cathepsin A)
MKNTRIALFAAIGLSGVMLGASCFAADTHHGPKPQATDENPAAAVTQHTVKMGSQTIHYTAVASKILLRDDANRPIASMSYIAYTEDGVPQEQRPVTFIWGGGPGSTSSGLQVVGFGPKLVTTTDAGHTPPAPYKIQDNPYSLLNVTDLVYIEEVDTGFGRLLNGSKISQFAGVDEDGQAFTQAIVRYLGMNNRWNSPKYIMGNSYGTTRDAVVAHDLEESGVDLKGVVLISTVLNFQTLEFGPGNDMPYIMFLPTYAAIAHYHHALPADLQALPLEQFLGKVQSFATGEYARLLMEGDDASAEEKQSVATRMAQYTGLSEQYIRYADFRISQPFFRKQLLLDRDQVVGRTDARFLGMDYDQGTANAEYDPLDQAIGGPYTTAMNYLLRNFLHYDDGADLFRSSCYGVCRWDWHRLTQRRGGGYGFDQGFADVSGDLREAMIGNPQLKLFVSCGYYDLATPYFAALYTYAHLNIGNLRKNITIKCYRSGHVSYLEPGTHEHMYGDLETFYRTSP